MVRSRTRTSPTWLVNQDEQLFSLGHASARCVVLRPPHYLFPPSVLIRALSRSSPYRSRVVRCVCETTQATNLTTTLTMCCVQHAAFGIFLEENVFAVARNFSDCFSSSTKSTILSIDDSLFIVCSVLFCLVVYCFVRFCYIWFGFV